MTVRTWLRSAALIVAGVMVAVVMVAPPAYSKKKKGNTYAYRNIDPDGDCLRLRPRCGTSILTKQVNFPTAWDDVDGAGWVVFSDPTAPSQPNDFGLPAGRMVTSLTHGLEYHPIVVMKDPTEYSDFTARSRVQTDQGILRLLGRIGHSIQQSAELLRARDGMPERLCPVASHVSG